MLDPINFSKAKNIVSFNFSPGSFKLVCAKISSAKPEINTMADYSIEGLSDEDASKVVSGAIKDLKQKNITITSCIDSQSIITKNIEIPSINEKEIREIIELQAGRYTPFAKEEIIIDYINIGTYHGSYTKVLLVILNKEIIKKQLTVFERLGLKLAKIQVAAESLTCVCTKFLGLKDKPSPLVLLNINNKNTDFIVSLRGKTAFIRNIPFGNEHFEQGQKEESIKFIDEIKKSIEAYRSEDIESMPGELLVIGAKDKTDMLRMPLTEQFGLPVRFISFQEYIAMNAQTMDRLKGNSQPSFINTIASALTFSETKVDLRPSELKMRLSFEEKSREIIKSGILVMTIIVIFCSLLIVKIYYKNQYLNKLQQQEAKIRPEVKELEEVSTKIAAARNYLENKKRSLDVIFDLYEILPESIYIKSISVDEKGAVLLKGTASAMSEVFNFLSTLENSKYFKDASATNTANRKEGNKDVADFEISCVLENR